MKQKELTDVLLTGGGIIPEEDVAKLKELGTGELFTPGTSTFDIAVYIKNWVAEHPRALV